MVLEFSYKTQDEIPAAYRELYSERNGQFELTGINGVKTQSDLDVVLRAKQNEVSAHNQTKQKLQTLESSLGSWSALKPEELQAKIDGYEALELAAKGAGGQTEEEIEKRVTARLKAHTAPLERKISEYEAKLSEADTITNSLKSADRERRLKDALRAARKAAGVLDTVEDDILVYGHIFDETEDGRFQTKENTGHTPGLTPELWIQDMLPKREHWLPPSEGGGARGARSNGGAGSRVVKRTAFEAMPPHKQMEHIKSGGQVVD